MQLLLFIAGIVAIILVLAALKLLFMVLKGLYRLTWWGLNRIPKPKRRVRERREPSPAPIKRPQRRAYDFTRRLQETPASSPDPTQLKRSTPRPEKRSPWDLYVSGCTAYQIIPVYTVNAKPPILSLPQAEDDATLLPAETLPVVDKFPAVPPQVEMNSFERFSYFYRILPPYIFLGKN